MERRNTAGADAEMGAERSVAALIDRWQTVHDDDALAALLELIRAPLARVVAHTLRRRGVHDPGACDDAWALVIEHLAALGSADSPRRATAFDSGRSADRGAGDPGWAYVRCVARSRARDIARDRRRRDHRAAAFVGIPSRASSGVENDETLTDAVERLRAAVAGLDERSRVVVTLLLEGKSQALIAHALGVCEGTVSRIRGRAIARLRAVLKKDFFWGGQV